MSAEDQEICNVCGIKAYPSLHKCGQLPKTQLFSHSPFELTPEQEQKIKEWRLHHCGQPVYQFEPGGIGTRVTVKCKGCNTELEVTDPSTW